MTHRTPRLSGVLGTLCSRWRRRGAVGEARTRGHCRKQNRSPETMDAVSPMNVEELPILTALSRPIDMGTELGHGAELDRALGQLGLD